MEPVAGAIPVMIPLNPWTSNIKFTVSCSREFTRLVDLLMYSNPAFAGDTEVIVPAAERSCCRCSMSSIPTPTDLGAANAIGKLNLV